MTEPLSPEQRAAFDAVHERMRFDRPTPEQVDAFWEAMNAPPPQAGIPYTLPRFENAPPPAPSRLRWLLGLVVTFAVTALADWAAARWTTTATFPLGFPGGPRIDAEARRGPISGLTYRERLRPHRSPP